MESPRILISTGGGDPSNYEKAIRLAGGVPVSCYCPPVFPLFDGLILAGGGDINPALLGEENLGSYDIDPRRDQAELALIDAYKRETRPILGICRGHQMVNVAMGGKLRQDLGDDLRWFHKKASHEGTGDVMHRIYTKAGSQMEAFYGLVTMVNSFHHQVVDSLGEGMLHTAWTEAGFIEATEHMRLPILTVQFHPERMRGKGLLIFRWFVEACCYHNAK